MTNSIKASTILFLALLALVNVLNIGSSYGSKNVLCIEREKQALIRFRKHIKDPSNRLSSWSASNSDCCNWIGIICDSITGHVKQLHLGNPNSYSENINETEYNNWRRSKLQGKISTSLLDLKHLSYLDLSYNDFGGIPIPGFIGSLVSLTYLNLSNAEFEGLVPHQLGNLSRLQYLDIQCFYPTKLYVDNLNWLSTVPSLIHLDLRGVDLSAASDWLLMINKLPALLELRFVNCGLVRLPPLSSVNFTSLRVLDLSDNRLDSPLPNWLFSLGGLVSLNWNGNILKGEIPNTIHNLTSLSVLNLADDELEGTLPRTMGNLCKLQDIDLSYNKLGGDILEAFESISGCLSDNLKSLSLSGNNFSGQLTDEIAKFRNLESLDLSYNLISGPIPKSIGILSFLESLSLAYNQLIGTIPESIGHLSNLQFLDISYNKLEGFVTEAHFSNLTNLIGLYASSNHLVLKVSPTWVPPFHLSFLDLRNWNIGPKFPMWLKSQDYIGDLDLSCTGISDSIPTWFWNLTSRNDYLNLSHNQIQGHLPDFIDIRGDPGLIYLGSNKLEGSVPRISGNVVELDLSNNSLSGNISDLLCRSKAVPNTLEILHLGENLLTGEIPDCWRNWKVLKVIKLGNNNLTGELPISIGNLHNLRSLHLNKNSLSGKIPASLGNCKELLTLNLGLNNFSGKVPVWFGSSLSNLMFLDLHSNKFRGEMPKEFCYLTHLRIMDLANNSLSGSIPKCLHNLTGMVVEQVQPYISYSIYYGSFLEEALVVIKGREFQYDTILTLVTSLDISNNKLSGDIPEEITALVKLRGLNLSGNHLTGKIPREIGNMQTLESVDLSKNLLSGSIPSSMSSMTSLNYLDLSYNNLSGPIPLSTQLQSLDNSSFIGNNLCGAPLSKNCTPKDDKIKTESKNRDGHDNSNKLDGFYASMVVGFVVGFWGIFGPLLYSRSWRGTYYGFLTKRWYGLCDQFNKCRSE